MNIPSNWDIVKDYENSLPKPNVWDIELAVVSKNNILWFSNNLIILWTQLSKTITSKEYSMLNNVWAKTDYLEYTSLSSKEITFPGEDIWIVYEFEAKYNSDTQKLRFLQTARVCNEVNAYFITLALPADTKDTSRYIDFISSFSCK
jgi:hypothetical protein